MMSDGGYGGGYNSGSSFVLIVVLFMIIVGTHFMSGY